MVQHLRSQGRFFILTYQVLVHVQNKDQLEFVVMDSPFLLGSLKEQCLLGEQVPPA